MSAAVRLPIEITDGWLAGHVIRRARKAYHCRYDRGRLNGGFCRKPINPGDLYVEGEGDPYNIGRNGMMLPDKYCPECAGAEALVAIAKADGRP
jgi:hypothetical protein